MSLFNVTRVCRVNPLSEINTGNPIFINTKELNGTPWNTYHVNLIYLLDRVFVKDYYGALSIEQERFLEEFLNYANKYTNDEMTYEELPYKFIQLDKFLGNYYGININEYRK